MSTFDYGLFVSVANELIKEFGQIGAISKPGDPSGPAYDPTAGTSVSRAAEFAVTKYALAEIDGSRVLAQDQKVRLAPNDLTDDPSTDEELFEADGTTWSIINVDAIRPADVTVLWVLQVRR